MFQVWDNGIMTFSSENVNVCYWWRDTFGGCILAVLENGYTYEKARYKPGLYRTLKLELA